MKKYLLSLAVAAACGPTYAADPFTGLSMGVSLGYTDNKVDYSGAISGKTSDNDFSGKVRAAYGFAMSEDWIGTVGIGYQLNKTKFGNGSYLDGGNKYDVSLKLKNDFALSFAPGYRITPDSLLYAKASYHKAKGEYDDQLTGSGETSHSGVGIGFGYLKGMSQSLSIGVEVEHIEYSRESANQSNGKPKQDAFNFVLNYRF